jgi:hypothetical protein
MRLLSITLVSALAFPPALFTAGPAFLGSLRSNGIVLMNSIPVPDGATVRSGDRITAGEGALAIIASPAFGRIEVRSGSEAELAAGRIYLERGAVASSRLPVEVPGHRLHPQDPERSWYAVAHRNGKLVVAAHRGNVWIASAGAQPLLLAQGAVAEQQSGPGQDSPPAVRKQSRNAPKRRRRAGAIAGASAGGGWTIGGLSHPASVALVIGVGAGVAAASVGVAVALNDDTPSPSQ